MADLGGPADTGGAAPISNPGRPAAAEGNEPAGPQREELELAVPGPLKFAVVGGLGDPPVALGKGRHTCLALGWPR